MLTRRPSTFEFADHPPGLVVERPRLLRLVVEHHLHRQATGYRLSVGIANQQVFEVERLVAEPTGTNADMGPAEVWEHCKLDEASSGLAKAAMDRLHLSARAFHRTLKLARTIADLAGEEQIGVSHLAEAVQYRQRGLD